jgi:hypothetical protein
METSILATRRLTKQKCQRCGRPFEKGDKVVSSGHRLHRRKGRGLRRYYHYQCWESLFFESQFTDEEIDRELETLDNIKAQTVPIFDLRMKKCGLS